MAGGETALRTAGGGGRGTEGAAGWGREGDDYGRPDVRRLQAGLEPSNGEKWGLSQWLRAHGQASAN